MEGKIDVKEMEVEEEMAGRRMKGKYVQHTKTEGRSVILK